MIKPYFILIDVCAKKNSTNYLYSGGGAESDLQIQTVEDSDSTQPTLIAYL